jgi:hypothetical protein
MGQVQVLTRADVKALGVVGKELEVLDWVLYDNLTFANGNTTTQFRYFQQSQGVGGVTLEKTNMEIPGQLPKGYKFVCQKIVFTPRQKATVVKADFLDMFGITHRGRAQLFIGTRPYFQAPLVDLIGGAFTGFAAGAVGGDIDLAYAAPRTIINGELEYSPAIPDNYSFSVLLDYDTAPNPTATLDMYCQLVGKLIRPRQG